MTRNEFRRLQRQLARLQSEGALAFQVGLCGGGAHVHILLVADAHAGAGPLMDMHCAPAHALALADDIARTATAGQRLKAADPIGVTEGTA